MSDDYKRALTGFLSTFVTEHKKSLIRQVLAHRTRYLTVVLEDIYQPQNASAVVRTCDCFGVQDLYIIEGRYRYEVNPKVVHGASKWVDIIKYEQEEASGDNTERCFRDLKAKGYDILVTSPAQDSLSVHDVPLNGKTALVFGTEISGVSGYAEEHADGLVHVPMYGFTESFNVSVSVALCLNVLRGKLMDTDLSWSLGEKEQMELTLSWYKKIVNQSEILEKSFAHSFFR